MVIKREVAYGIVRGLSEFWKSEELQDFTVTVGSTQFGCHRFLLAACSGFFRGLFRSGMKEVDLNCAAINNISVETFSLILESMYTGHGVLTKDNVIDIWHAANQLQITFLTEECDKFIKRSLSLENYEDYLYHARLLDRKNILEEIWNFVCGNFVSFSSTKCFLDLSKNELLKLVQNQDLKVSNEDIVIDSIFRWIDHESDHGHDLPIDPPLGARRLLHNSDNTETFEQPSQDKTHEPEDGVIIMPQSEGGFYNRIINRDALEEISTLDQDNTIQNQNNLRKQGEGLNKRGPPSLAKMNEKLGEDLTDFLSAARTCLCSVDALEAAMQHPKIINNQKARNLILKALFYHIKTGRKNGQWPSSAIHRACYQFENVGVSFCIDINNKLTELWAFPFTRKSWYELKTIPVKKMCMFPKCININNNLNIFSSCDAVLYRSIYRKKTWETESCSFAEGQFTFTLENILLDIIDRYLYIFKPELHRLLKLDTATNKIYRIELPFTKTSPVQHILALDKMILIFFPATNGSETAVHCFDTVKFTWTELNRMEGPAEWMTSFRNDQDTFVLQTSGDLWRVVRPQADVIDFDLVDKLWTCDRQLHGAVSYVDDLFIFGIKSPADDFKHKDSLPGVFKQIHFVENESKNHLTFIPAIVAKDNIVYDP